MEARGIAAEIGAKWRLQRKARSRSDAPRIIVGFTAASSFIGTIGGIGICTAASIVVIVRGSITDTAERTIGIGAVIVSRRSSSSIVPTW